MGSQAARASNSMAEGEAAAGRARRRQGAAFSGQRDPVAACHVAQAEGPSRSRPHRPVPRGPRVLEGSRKSSCESKSCTGWRSSPRSRSGSWRSCRLCWAGSSLVGRCARCERSPRQPGRSRPPAWTDGWRSRAPRTNSRTSETQSTRSWPGSRTRSRRNARLSPTPHMSCARRWR